MHLLVQGNIFNLKVSNMYFTFDIAIAKKTFIGEKRRPVERYLQKQNS